MAGTHSEKSFSFIILSVTIRRSLTGILLGTSEVMYLNYVGDSSSMDRDAMYDLI